MTIEEMISAVQRELGVDVDGKAGPQTWAAIYQRLVPKSSQTRHPLQASESIHPTSARYISTLLPEVQPFARALIEKSASVGIQIRVISGLRSYEEQDALYAQGRTRAGTIVTNAKAGYSSHNFGIAFDVGVFEGNRYVPDSGKYKAVGALGVDLGLEWGGSWKTIVDQPHFQLRPIWALGLPERTMLAELRSRQQLGGAIYA